MKKQVLLNDDISAATGMVSRTIRQPIQEQMLSTGT
jgi:hypothetical protein